MITTLDQQTCRLPFDTEWFVFICVLSRYNQLVAIYVVISDRNQQALGSNTVVERLSTIIQVSAQCRSKT